MIGSCSTVLVRLSPRRSRQRSDEVCAHGVGERREVEPHLVLLGGELTVAEERDAELVEWSVRAERLGEPDLRAEPEAVPLVLRVVPVASVRRSGGCPNFGSGFLVRFCVVRVCQERARRHVPVRRLVRVGSPREMEAP